MKYFLDTEFHEYTRKVKFLGVTLKEIPTIDLISIGIVSEDGREFYAVHNGFDVKSAWENEWVRINVLYDIYTDLKSQHEHKILRLGMSGTCKHTFTESSVKDLIKTYGYSSADIANSICAFIYGDDCGGSGMSAIEMAMKYEINDKTKEPEFYAYYADYDWVVFCWIFGRMIELPKGFPKYCRDLKQIYDEKQANICARAGVDPEYCDDRSRLIKEQGLKALTGYPKQHNEHNALEDAKWNYELYKFLMTIFT